MAVWQPDSTWGQTVKGASAPLPRRQRLLDALRQSAGIESGRIGVWSPVLLVLGIWSYFSLNQEPPMVLGFVLLAAAAPVLTLWRHHRALLILSVIALGFSAAQLRTAWVATPLLRAFTPTVVITGYVSELDVRGKARFQLVLDVSTATTIPQQEMPRRVRLSVVSREPPPLLGDAISITADLAPLPRPVSPAAFDFGRSLYFQSIGADGRSKGPITRLDQPVPSSYLLNRSFHRVRAAIGARIKAIIPGPLGSFADALVTGERASIPRSMNQSLQASGLYHILSISGLHMSLVAGGAYWLVRALLALFPVLALRYQIKKWAAGAALVVGACYMLLADSGAATERSFIMIAVVLFSVMVDRPALSLHNLAVAAVIILLTAPEQAMSASFQMSFMAVMGLAAFFAWWQTIGSKDTARQPPSGWFKTTLKKTWTVAIASIATSMIAGVLSGIPAAHHFGRIAPFGVVANALALPVVSLVVMPSAMIAVMLMPFGLESLPLQTLQAGLTAVMAVSDWVANWPQSNLALPRISAGAAALLSLAAACLCLSASWLRLVAMPLALAALLAWYTHVPPDILVDDRAANVAIRTSDGLVPVDAEKATFTANRWLREEGDKTPIKRAVQRLGWQCANNVCTATIKGQSIAFLRDTAALVKPCPRADILVAQYPLRHACKGKVVTIDRFDVWRNGAHAITIPAAGPVVQSVRHQQGNRPWVYVPRARAKK